MMRPWPQTLLWRTFLLLAVLMLLSVIAWFNLYRTYERVPHAHQMAQMVESVINLTRSALVNARADKRRALLLELSRREGIRIFPADKNEIIAPLPNRPFLQLVEAQLRSKLGPTTRLTLERNGEKALFVSFRIDDEAADGKGQSKDEDDEADYWVALPRERIERVIPWQWMGWGFAALLLSLIGAYLIVFRVTRPLKTLSKAALEIGRGHRPQPVGEDGPSEIAALAHAFNQMSADLARLDSDRALILAGISHDLRTPLTRLRMAIEMSGADAGACAGMALDIEEMDQTIGQFLDFARDTSGEALQATDLALLLGDLAANYTRRGKLIETELAALPELRVRPRGLRRAVVNLVDNALRYAGEERPVLIALREEEGEIRIEVCDRGPGIPAEHIERVKLPFARQDEARSNVSGAGLGLAIVDRVARSHGGKLSLLARPGGGLVARISLPRAEAATETNS